MLTVAGFIAAEIDVGSPADAPLQGRVKRVHGIGSARRLEIDLVRITASKSTPPAPTV